MNNWVAVYYTKQLYLAHIVRDVLRDNDIEAVILNKQDSAYINIGDVEVVVKPDNVIKAKHIISKHEL